MVSFPTATHKQSLKPEVMVVYRHKYLASLVLIAVVSCAREELGNSQTELPLEMVTIVAQGDTANFLMGSTDTEIAAQPSIDDGDYFTTDEQPAHEVTLTIPYAVSKFEITNSLFCEIMNHAIDRDAASLARGDLTDTDDIKYLGIDSLDGGEYLGVQHGISIVNDRLIPNPGYEDDPVHGVSWYGAVAFSNFLSEHVGLEPVYDLSTWNWDKEADGFRLPTEAEWEYAARGNERFTYAWGNEIDFTYLNYYSTFEKRIEQEVFKITTPVGFFDGSVKEGIHTKDNASPFNVYDMTGNLWEWVWDWYGREYYAHSPTRDPNGPTTGDDRPPYSIEKATRTWRGCGWAGNDAYSRVAKRWSAHPDYAINETGFRVARSLY